MFATMTHAQATGYNNKLTLLLFISIPPFPECRWVQMVGGRA